MSEIRYNRLYDEYVISAPERMHRPDKTRSMGATGSDLASCPFCEGNETMTPPEIYAFRATPRDSVGWSIRVIPNLYKAVEIEAPHHFSGGTFSRWEGFGAHEIIIDTSRHTVSMVQWSQTEATLWLKTLQHRFVDLTRDVRLAYISLFKNEGAGSGATQSHSHTQLIALPIVPKEEQDRFRCEREHFLSSGEKLCERIAADEEKEKVRLLFRIGKTSVFCPYGSTHPFEIMIVRRGETFGKLDDKALHEYAKAVLKAVEALKARAGIDDFNVVFMTPNLRPEEGDGESGWGIRILPRLYRYGGFETGTKMLINPMRPERAAKILRGENDE
ncbi:MAG: UTP--glucose-1-phosphate uridylyltransferase [Sulfuricurvum sp.]